MPLPAERGLAPIAREMLGMRPEPRPLLRRYRGPCVVRGGRWRPDARGHSRVRRGEGPRRVRGHGQAARATRRRGLSAVRAARRAALARRPRARLTDFEVDTLRFGRENSVVRAQRLRAPGAHRDGAARSHVSAEVQLIECPEYKRRWTIRIERPRRRRRRPCRSSMRAKPMSMRDSR